MTRKRRPATPVSRRRFLGAALLGSAAALVAAVPGAAAATRRRPAAKPAAGPRPAKLQAEIVKQKGYLADTLKTIRAYELPPGSEPAFVFAAVKAKKRGGAR